MSDSLAMLRGILRSTMSNDNATLKNAEKTLQGLEGQPGFAIELLKLIAVVSQLNTPEDKSIRQSAAVTFKNAINRRWKPNDEEEFSRIPDADRETIKLNVIDLMCSAPKDVQKQLGESVSIIAKWDFPEKWEGLIAQLVNKLNNCQDIQIINGVMSTANSLFRRYRDAMRTDALFKELKFCLVGFQAPLLDMYQKMTIFVHQPTTVQNKSQVELAMETVYQMTRIFYSLNNQDIPEFFEDNMALWMEDFAKYLIYQNNLITDPNEEDEPGVIERVQAAVIENLNLYASKYEEEFAPHLPRFTQLIWQLLINVNSQPKYDIMATQAIKFLTAVCSKQMYVDYIY